jgi:glycerol uptake facilitator-like aquaporin
MTVLDIFALIVLIVLIICGLGVWALLGMYPGKIARQRNHPQADAINVCGWWGAITLGVLTPVAFIWAYTNPAVSLTGGVKPGPTAEIEVAENNDAGANS